MSERTTSTVRIPTNRLRAAVDAAIAEYRRERWAVINEAVRAEMEIPAPKGWFARRFSKHPAATREEALARVKAPREGMMSWSLWSEVWFTGSASYERLSALKSACDLGLDTVDVSVNDVALFQDHFAPLAEGYR